MAANERSPQEVRRDIAREREQLAEALKELRQGAGEAGNLGGKLPVVAAGALGVGFVLAGGIGATMRLLARRGREGRERARVGPFSIVERR
ncbi:MAG: DUF3618 domain-containing protein [Actinomycetota bacterium]|nr:DUF3618 domain-containing protein [Actinomycetota bacterium]